MKNLKIINLNYTKIYLLIFFLLFYSSSSISLENSIIFKINDKVFTTLDYEKRLKYLDFVGNNSELDKKLIINDFISANLFYEYYKETNNSQNYEDKLNEIFNNIINTNKLNEKSYNYIIDKETIIKNIEIDFVRKIVLENFLNNKINELRINNKEIDLLYNIKIKYINLNIDNKIKILNEINNLKIINFDEIISILKLNNVNYFVKKNEINNIEKIDEKIRRKILANENFFVIENNNKLSLIFIEKNFETYEGIVANLYSVKSTQNLDAKFLNCNNLKEIKDEINITSKEYNFLDLNKKLKENLVNINDYVNFNSNNQNVYVILCDIKFNKDLLNNINLNKLINLNVNKIENEFINEYSKVYNLEINE